MRGAGRVTGIVALGVAGLAVSGVVATATLALMVARRIVTPPVKRDDVRIYAVDLVDGLIVLAANAETVVPGRYGLWFGGDSGYARIGELVDVPGTPAGTVTRRIERVMFGDLAAARGGRWSGWYYLTPSDLGHAYRDTEVQTPLGAAPAWLVPGPNGSTRWAILVHGRAVTRSEPLRAVDTFLDAGYNCLLVSYRNDGEAPRSDDGRYALGDREWADVDAALDFVRERGATDVVLMGYSMGGATVLQTSSRSEHADLVRGVVLESPVVDWFDTIDYQVVSLRRMPRSFGQAVTTVLGRPGVSRLAGLATQVDLPRLDWVTRAAELDRPVLLLHSDGDRFVTSRGSRALAAARPDLVTFEAFDTAQHTRLWNFDQERWTSAVRRWLNTLG